ncbi:MAG: phage tail tube protein [Burkholderiaceae bacterium]|nr:phage tail tube protein [Burkholderiaceae bacterium]
MPLLSRKRVILAKIETTYGTDSVPTGAANAILVRNLTLTPQDTEFADRDLVRPYLGRSEQLPAAIRAMVEFEVELAGSGTAGTAPGWGALMRACAHSETVSAGVSVTYAPISQSFESASIYFNVDGVLHRLTGARGTMTLSLRAKEIPTIKFTLTGLYNAVTDAALPTPTYTPFQKPLVVNNINTTPFSLHSFAAVMSELSIDQGGSLVHRTLVGGAENVLFTDRQTQGSITIEATTVAEKDWWTIARNATLGALAITHGTVAGNRVAISSSGVQLTAPNYTDLDGIHMLQMGMNFVPSGSGNNEYSIVVS